MGILLALALNILGGAGNRKWPSTEFNNSDELWNYLFPDIVNSPPSSLIAFSVSDEVTKNWRITQVQQNHQPLTIWQKTLKEHWDMWISDWSLRTERIKQVVYKDKEFELILKQNSPKIDKLHKCHKEKIDILFSSIFQNLNY